MKTIVLSGVIFLCAIHTSLAQKDQHRSLRLYKTWISKYGEPKKQKGVLFEIKDSSILVSDSYRPNNYLLSNFRVIEIDVKNIDVIKIRKKNNIGNGILAGSISGVVLGGLIGYFANDQKTNHLSLQVNMALGISITAGFGTIIGYVLGSIRKTVHIHGTQQQINQEKQKLTSYSLIKVP